MARAGDARSSKYQSTLSSDGAVLAQTATSRAANSNQLSRCAVDAVRQDADDGGAWPPDASDVASDARSHLRPLDISRVRTEGGHDACLRANAPVEVRSRLSALLARLAPPWGNVMSRAGWYADLVEPLRALTPPACSDKHVSDPELGLFWQELGRLLRASDYFTQHIEPLRRKGGYIR